VKSGSGGMPASILEVGMAIAKGDRASHGCGGHPMGIGRQCDARVEKSAP
jgi:hypothetical protein